MYIVLRTRCTSVHFFLCSENTVPSSSNLALPTFYDFIHVLHYFYSVQLVAVILSYLTTLC